MSNTPEIYDVVIAGAGPVGLFLACELRLANRSVLVLEQASDPYSPLKQLPFGMRGLSAPTIESFDRRGLLDELTERQRAKEQSNTGQSAAHWMHQQRRPGGHFAGIQFFHDNIDISKWAYRLADSTPVTLASSMEEIEAVLEKRATAMGAEIRRGAGVEGF
ncbi:FAD-dependent monooxygenase, partial [Rhizobium sp.]|uniref:FAD-dependent monooxygenase n=1 Tax=Rhizobium sp. TaxID=391 RepID=UPI0028A7082D